MGYLDDNPSAVKNAHYYRRELKKAEQQIRELETSVREWSDRAMEFSDLASRYEEELAALRQQQGEPVAYLRDDGDGGLEFSAPGDGFAVYREASPEQEHVHADDVSEKRVAETAKNKHETVAWFQSTTDTHGRTIYSQVQEQYKNDPDVFPLYREAAPRPKE